MQSLVAKSDHAFPAQKGPKTKKQTVVIWSARMEVNHPMLCTCALPAWRTLGAMRILSWFLIAVGALLCLTFIFVYIGLALMAIGVLLQIAAAIRTKRARPEPTH